MRALFAALLFGHGWVHGVMWALPYSEQALADLPMDPAHSWLLGDTREFALGVAILTAVSFMVAGVAYLADTGWWPAAGLTAAVLSTALLSLYFSPWWALGYVINAFVALAAWRDLSS